MPLLYRSFYFCFAADFLSLLCACVCVRASINLSSLYAVSLLRTISFSLQSFSVSHWCSAACECVCVPACVCACICVWMRMWQIFFHIWFACVCLSVFLLLSSIICDQCDGRFHYVCACVASCGAVMRHIGEAELWEGHTKLRRWGKRQGVTCATVSL